MTNNLSSNNIDNDECNLKNEKNDYQILITRLREIKAKIALLEKTIFR